MLEGLHGHGLRHYASSTLACAAVATLMGAGSYLGYEDVCKRLTRRLRTTLRSVPVEEKSNESTGGR